MKTPFEEYDENKGTYEEYQQLVRLHEWVQNETYYLQAGYLRILEKSIGPNERLVLRTRLLWEEGLFCPVCRKRVLSSTSEIKNQRCDLCCQ